MKHPLRTQLTHIFNINLIEAAVSPSCVIAIVRQPVLANWLRE
jgi:hypothetical protein